MDKIDWNSDKAILRACELVYCDGDHWKWGRMNAEERQKKEADLRRTIQALMPMLN